MSILSNSITIGSESIFWMLMKQMDAVAGSPCIADAIAEKWNDLR